MSRVGVIVIIIAVCAMSTLFLPGCQGREKPAPVEVGEFSPFHQNTATMENGVFVYSKNRMPRVHNNQNESFFVLIAPLKYSSSPGSAAFSFDCVGQEGLLVKKAKAGFYKGEPSSASADVAQLQPEIYDMVLISFSYPVSQTFDLMTCKYTLQGTDPEFTDTGFLKIKFTD